MSETKSEAKTKSYYKMNPRNPLPVETILKRWQENNQKLYDPDTSFHALYPAKYISNFTDVDRKKGKYANKSEEEWEELRNSIKNKGYDKDKPVHIKLGKNGIAKIAEGHHRLAVVMDSNPNMKVPVRLHFYQNVSKPLKNKESGKEMKDTDKDKDNNKEKKELSDKEKEKIDKLVDILSEEKWVDEIPGGLADKSEPSDFERSEVYKGAKVELEHTDDVKKAIEIALDHLKEDPNYYKKLAKIEPHHDINNEASAFPLYNMREGETNIKLGGHKVNRFAGHAWDIDVNRPIQTTKIDGLFEDDDEKDYTTIQKHIMHLYEDLELTFRELFDIIDSISNGSKILIEKTDGYNFYLSFENGQAKAARNNTQVKNGGMTIDDVMAHDWSSLDVKQAFVNALSSFERAVYKLPEDMRGKLFGDGKIYYNTEIIGPETRNVIPYDRKFISIHRNGHVYSTGDGDIEDIDTTYQIKKSLKFLEETLSDLSSAAEDTKYNITQTPATKLQNEPTGVDVVKEKIKQEINNYGLDEEDRIYDYVLIRTKRLLKPSIGDLGDEEIEAIIQYNLGEIHLNDIENEHLKDIARDYSKYSELGKKLKKKAIRPLEYLIHKFEELVVRNISSNFTYNKQQATKKIQDDLEEAIKGIKSYYGDAEKKAKEILFRNMKKIGNIENVNTNVEGVVFYSGGNTYKLTGNFAPINQILNIYRNGRGNSIPKIKDKTNMINEGKKNPLSPSLNMNGRSVAAIPGAFKPPHAGHWSLVEHMVSKKTASGEYVIDELIVFISPKSRTGHSSDRSVTVTAEMSKKIWELFIQQFGDEEAIEQRIKPVISNSNSPVKSTYEFMEQLEAGDTLWVAKGEKDKNDRRFDNLHDYSMKENLGVNIEVETTDLYHSGISGAIMRDFLAENDRESFMGFLPDHLTLADRRMVWEFIIQSQPEQTIVRENKEIKLDEIKTNKNVIDQLKFYSKKLKRLQKQTDPDKELSKEMEHVRDKIRNLKNKLDNYNREQLANEFDLEELSAAGAGAVAGSPAQSFGSAQYQNKQAQKSQLQESMKREIFNAIKGLKGEEGSK